MWMVLKTTQLDHLGKKAVQERTRKIRREESFVSAPLESGGK